MPMPAKGRHGCECIKDSVRGNSPDRVFLRVTVKVLNRYRL